VVACFRRVVAKAIRLVIKPGAGCPGQAARGYQRAPRRPGCPGRGAGPRPGGLVAAFVAGEPQVREDTDDAEDGDSAEDGEERVCGHGGGHGVTSGAARTVPVATHQASAVLSRRPSKMTAAASASVACTWAACSVANSSSAFPCGLRAAESSRSAVR